MAYVVNGQLVSDQLIRQEQARIGGYRQWAEIQDENIRAKRIREAAEFSAIDITLVEQAAASDPRPVDPALMEQEMRSQKTLGGGRGPARERELWLWIEWNLRLQRTAREMTASAKRPTLGDLEEFYNANRENFRGPAVFKASHIVKHVEGEQSEAPALVGIEAALKELEAGLPFSDVAERHSDCKGNGGDLDEFVAGTMVQEFEDAIRYLMPGQRTGIFRTAFGFHIARLRAKIPAGPLSFAEVREDIARGLIAMRQHHAYLRVVEELRSRSDIRRVPDEVSTPKHEPEDPSVSS